MDDGTWKCNEQANRVRYITAHLSIPRLQCLIHSSYRRFTTRTRSGSISKPRRFLRVIADASSTLTPAERNYHLHAEKLQFLALKWSITEQFRDYLYYSPRFIVYTDNNPLTYVLSTAKLNATGQR